VKFDSSDITFEYILKKLKTCQIKKSVEKSMILKQHMVFNPTGTIS
jgi:hypothetical protein